MEKCKKNLKVSVIFSPIDALLLSECFPSSAHIAVAEIIHFIYTERLEIPLIYWL